eukprot:TRINITY_DN8496_c0_g1_i1.p1 TRINITY_DN8496_c0_g1~~TRINITY_DN8496_c0_g1_i1.p1  ORF type:complete len:242 (-),score=37.88 TRINITY_DN8496_c0_g1_i1:20-745(-)
MASSHPLPDSLGSSSSTSNNEHNHTEEKSIQEGLLEFLVHTSVPEEDDSNSSSSGTPTPSHSVHDLPPSNVLVIHQLEDSCTESDIQKQLGFSELLLLRVIQTHQSSFVERKNFAVLIFKNVDDAIEARNRFELAKMLRTGGKCWKIVFGKELAPNSALLSQCMRAQSDPTIHGYLVPPPDNRQWLISPPASPPVGWKPRSEDVFVSNPCPDLTPIIIDTKRSILLPEKDGFPEINVTNFD